MIVALFTLVVFLDVSKSAAAKLDMLKKGTAKIKLEVVSSVPMMKEALLLHKRT
jgi:rare lipoprotein A (peptidoglycan hydrolase)